MSLASDTVQSGQIAGNYTQRDDGLIQFDDGSILDPNTGQYADSDPNAVAPTSSSGGSNLSHTSQTHRTSTTSGKELVYAMMDHAKNAAEYSLKANMSKTQNYGDYLKNVQTYQELALANELMGPKVAEQWLKNQGYSINNYKDMLAAQHQHYDNVKSIMDMYQQHELFKPKYAGELAGALGKAYDTQSKQIGVGKAAYDRSYAQSRAQAGQLKAMLGAALIGPTVSYARSKAQAGQIKTQLGAALVGPTLQKAQLYNSSLGARTAATRAQTAGRIQQNNLNAKLAPFKLNTAMQGLTNKQLDAVNKQLTANSKSLSTRLKAQQGLAGSKGQLSNSDLRTEMYSLITGPKGNLVQHPAVAMQTLNRYVQTAGTGAASRAKRLAPIVLQAALNHSHAGNKSWLAYNYNPKANAITYNPKLAKNPKQNPPIKRR